VIEVGDLVTVKPECGSVVTSAGVGRVPLYWLGLVVEVKEGNLEDPNRLIFIRWCAEPLGQTIHCDWESNLSIVSKANVNYQTMKQLELKLSEAHKK